MMRTMMALVLATALVGCDEKKEVAPAVAPSGAAVAPSGAAVAPSGAVVAPSGAVAAPSGESSSGAAVKGAKTEKPTTFPPASGMMSHGKVENGTLHYNPPPQQNPSPPVKKDDLKQ